MSDAIRPASTVILLRAATPGFEVFLLERNRGMGFMPSMWVFPGGRVDSTDGLDGHPHVRGAPVGPSSLLGESPVAHGVAAVRETFEEAGVFVGDGALPADQRAPLAAGEVALTALLEASQAVVDLPRLHAWARWITPKGETRRYDTCFYVVVADDAEGEHDRSENVASTWLRPREALDRGFMGMPMAPPTWWALRELCAYRSTEEVLAAAATRPTRPISPIGVFEPGRFAILLPGHPEHPEPADPHLPARIALTENGWQATFAG